MVHESHLGQGVVPEAVRQIHDFAFKKIGLFSLEIVVAETNFASRRVAEKAKAIDEGPQQARIRIPRVSHDALMYALINPKANRYIERSNVNEYQLRKPTVIATSKYRQLTR